jgi:hypothetical protein
MDFQGKKIRRGVLLLDGARIAYLQRKEREADQRVVAWVLQNELRQLSIDVINKQHRKEYLSYCDMTKKADTVPKEMC